jgi:hypothetical protein
MKGMNNMSRITESQLLSLVARLNNITGNPVNAYTETETGFQASIGNFHLSHAYGGVALMQMCNEGGGCSMPLMQGHTTKRDCYDQIYAFVKGIEYARSQK